jgi:hypothetical protein
MSAPPFQIAVPVAKRIQNDQACNPIGIRRRKRKSVAGTLINEKTHLKRFLNSKA